MKHVLGFTHKVASRLNLRTNLDNSFCSSQYCQGFLPTKRAIIEL